MHCVCMCVWDASQCPPAGGIRLQKGSDPAMLCTEASCIWLLLLPQEGPEGNLSGGALPQEEGGSEFRESIETHRRQHVFVHLARTSPSTAQHSSTYLPR